MTKKTDIFHHPTVLRGLDILVVNDIISHYYTLTHNMLHFNGIKESLYDFQNISLLYWKLLTLPSQISLDGTDAAVVNSILRQNRVSQGCMVIQHIFNLYADSVIREPYIEELGINTVGQLVYNLRNADDIALYSHKIVPND